MNWEEILKIIVNDYLLRYGIRIIAAVIILAVGFKITGVITKSLFKKRKARLQDETAFKFAVNLLSAGMKILVFVITATVVGIPSASFVAVLGSVGVAVGLALQGGLSNLAGGVMLVFFKPYSIGDFIEIGSYSGTVADIGIFYTTVLSLENRKVMIPNATAVNNTVKNYSSEEFAQIVMDISVSYGDDLENVKDILEKTAADTENVDKTKPVKVLVKEYAESGINLSFRCWCESSVFWDTKNELFIKIKSAFDKEGIEIPYNKLDVHIIENKNGSEN